MQSIFDSDREDFFILMNRQGSYSIWPSKVDLPDNWFLIDGACRSQKDCLDKIEKIWDSRKQKSLKLEVNTSRIM